MEMIKATALQQDMETEVYSGIFFAEDEDDAINQLEAYLQENHIAYEFCMAETLA
ncbi:MAG: hypothetical protein PUD77_10715 [Clostridiales bacterium]|nr:hypothetical protein [Clostridiales bacterium]